jgi:hypothetical protein
LILSRKEKSYSIFVIVDVFLRELYFMIKWFQCLISSALQGREFMQYDISQISITALVASLVAIASFFGAKKISNTLKKKARVRRDDVARLALSLSEEEKSCLRAFQFYPKYAMPNPFRNKLIEKGLIAPIGDVVGVNLGITSLGYDVGITSLGYDVGKELGVFDHADMIMTIY